MKFDEWWNSISEGERKLLGRNNANYVWICAYERGRQAGMRQERALWELSKITQEMEHQNETKNN